MSDHQHHFVGLDTEDAVSRITLGDHPESSMGSVALDVAMIEALETGEIRAASCSLCGVLAFMRVTS